ncbi:putative RNA-binding protein/ KRR1 [Giardia duodenalis assemblage B]|uniref:KRR1 small subunit processome component n=1 Tax=Giardia duodenalis assemblage B TaxID=1394984 RepID=A0A132NQ24_GIAIN|nr:putative RNA-binding protein/ KRR1 [Giardia intestinalis assemblage B]
MEDEMDQPQRISREKRRNYPERDMTGRTDVPEGWREPEFRPEDNKSGALLDVSSFSTLFPMYREPYITSIWSDLANMLSSKYGIAAELDLQKGTITVQTTDKTWDPAAILSARNMIWMLSRSMTFEQAKRCFENEVDCDIIRIKNMTPRKDSFIKRRARFVGPNAQTLKAIELLTDTKIQVQGNTVAVMGASRGVGLVRNIVTDCIERNIHPVQHIKTLMIKRELAKIPEMANEDWSRFIPTFKKKNTKPYKPAKVAKRKREKQEAAISKIDQQLASGEYFARRDGEEKVLPRRLREPDALPRDRAKQMQQGKGGHTSSDSEIPSDGI